MRPPESHRPQYYRSLAMMVGYIIGVGMFGLPFLVQQAGLAVFLVYLAVFGLLQYFIHLGYANIIIATGSFHRLPGQAGRYLGPWAKSAALVAKMGGNLGALLAYLIILGLFGSELLGPYLGGGPLVYTAACFVICAVVVRLGMGAVAGSELVMSLLMFAAIAALVVIGLPAVEPQNFRVVSWPHLLLPYGALLMALDGSGALPTIACILGKDARVLKRVVRWGTVLSALATALFVIVIVGVSGPHTSVDALAGLQAALPGPIISCLLVFGIFAILTSYFMVTEAVTETLNWDYGVRPVYAWAAAAFVPFLLYLAGLQSLQKVIGFTGGALGGFVAIMIVLTLRAALKRGDSPLLKLKMNVNWLFGLVVLYGLGIVYSVWEFLR